MNPAQTALKTKLEELECHFTWGLELSRYMLLIHRDHLEDIGSDEGFPWLGQMYNLWAYIHHTLDSTDAALQCLSKAEEAFHLNSPSDTMGPWQLVHYGNLAWVHYHLDNQAESQRCLTKVEGLLRDYPSPSQGELHPEVCVEKAWTLMKFGQDKRRKAIDYFQMAIRMEPERKEWQSSHALALDSVYCFQPINQQKESEVLEELRLAKEHDPDNLYVASIYLLRLGRNGQVRRKEAQQIAQQILKKPVSCYSGLRPLLQFYRTYLSYNEAIDLANEALERHPNVRYLKKQLANSYKWKIFSKEDSPRRQSMCDRAISLYTDLISLYPETSLKDKLELASIYAESDRTETANQIYENLFSNEQDPDELQILYFHYAKYSNFHIQDRNASIDYHKKAAEIPNPNQYGKKSFNILRKIEQRGRNQRCAEIREFLKNLSSHNE
uniref:interferon-induced protein with tetratricopeptide repeats 5-like n=1 Tax=Oncorhynchus gorbuscha TaxID=8017 RepID=UPI001EAF8AFE|nr:interferon-induced protein with tetratricopeptide repeats 5-like [Oncorhynchus gorbuscha]